MKSINAFLAQLFRPVRLSVVAEGSSGGEGSPPPTAAQPAASPPPAGQGQPGTAPAGTAPAGNGASSASLIGADGKFSAEFAKQFPTLAPKFTSPDALVKSYQNLESMLGKQGKFAPISATSSPEEIAAFRKGMGVPDSAKGYEITKPKEIGGKPLPEGLWDDKVIDGYTAKFHELGIGKDAAAKLVAFGMEQGMTQFTSLNDQIAKSKAEGEAKLKSDWGLDYDKNVALAERGAAVAGLTAQMVAEDPFLANNPTFLRAMKAVGALTAEGSSPGARGGNQNLADPTTRLNELQAMMAHPNYRKTPAYMNHDNAMAEMRQLLDRKEAMRH